MGRSVSISAVSVEETTLHWGDTFARDIALTVANATNITWLFGDTLGVTAPGPLAVSCSGARSTFATPFTVTNFATASVGQVVPFNAAESSWNIAGGHAFRYGLPPLGAVLEGQSARIFYVLDTPLTPLPSPPAFYAGFPMLKLGTAVLGPTDQVVTRNEATEVALATNAWPTGFIRAPDGSVRFYIQSATDGEVYSTFKRGRWTVTGGFEFSTKIAFRLDAGMGISQRYCTPTGQILATWIDRAGTVRLGVLTGKVSGSTALYAIPSWASPWDGYGAVFINTNTDTKTFFIAYNAALPGFLQGAIPILRVTLA